jgi:hypothetical protein
MSQKNSSTPQLARKYIYIQKLHGVARQYRVTLSGSALPLSNYLPKKSQNDDKKSVLTAETAPTPNPVKRAISTSAENTGFAPLVKTCETSVHFEEPTISAPDFTNPTDFAAEITALVAGGGSVKDHLEYDEKRRKQKRIKPSVKPAFDFYVLKELRELQDAKKAKIKHCEDLKLLDFNGTDFKEVRSIDPETGELLTFTVKGKGKKRKFILQSSQSKIQDRFSMQNTMAKLLPEHRVSKCLRVTQSNSKPLTVFKSNKYDTISVSNVQTCGSVWDCPVCAAKITERRRAEANKAIEAHKAAGGSISFVTRTAPHTKHDSLVSLRNQFRDSDRFLKQHRQYKKMRCSFNVEGDIKVFEITVNWLNGWHLHVHEVIFHAPDAFEGAAVSTNPAYVEFLKNFESSYYDLWQDAAVKAGFDEPTKAHGLQVQNGDFAADYVTKYGIEPTSKWGVDSELTKAHIKKAQKGYSPWDLIRLYRDTLDERLVPIIQEYAHSMHGQQQLIWSTGLKKQFGIGEVSDEELADRHEDDAEELGVLSPVQWKFIVKNDLRIEFYLLAVQGWDVVTDFLHSFEKYPKIFSILEVPKNSPF